MYKWDVNFYPLKEWHSNSSRGLNILRVIKVKSSSKLSKIYPGLICSEIESTSCFFKDNNFAMQKRLSSIKEDENLCQMEDARLIWRRHSIQSFQVVERTLERYGVTTTTTYSCTGCSISARPVVIFSIHTLIMN